jgi:N-acyl-D-aspartate/D-glutamate deacylase
MNFISFKNTMRKLPLLLAGFVAASAIGADFDIVVRNGRVADGTGNPSFIGDVAIKDGRIAAIGKFRGSGKEEIDARGLVVAPGFIDVHTHADEVADCCGWKLRWIHYGLAKVLE